jgi:hypothetical protein
LLKIGIITINDNNYGNRLQKYVLQKCLFNKFKIEKVETIWYDIEYKCILVVRALHRKRE